MVLGCLCVVFDFGCILWLSLHLCFPIVSRKMVSHRSIIEGSILVFWVMYLSCRSSLRSLVKFSVSLCVVMPLAVSEYRKSEFSILRKLIGGGILRIVLV